MPVGGVLIGLMPEVVHMIYYALFDEYKNLGLGLQTQLAIKTKKLVSQVKLHFKAEAAPTLTISYIAFSVLALANFLKLQRSRGKYFSSLVTCITFIGPWLDHFRSMLSIVPLITHICLLVSCMA